MAALLAVLIAVAGLAAAPAPDSLSGNGPPGAPAGSTGVYGNGPPGAPASTDDMSGSGPPG
jgi:hypothetical protein